MEFKIGDTVTLAGHDEGPVMVIVGFGGYWIGEISEPNGITWYGAAKWKKRKTNQTDGVVVAWIDSELHSQFETFPAEALEFA